MVKMACSLYHKFKNMGDTYLRDGKKMGGIGSVVRGCGVKSGD